MIGPNVWGGWRRARGASHPVGSAAVVALAVLTALVGCEGRSCGGAKPLGDPPPVGMAEPGSVAEAVAELPRVSDFELALAEAGFARSNVVRGTMGTFQVSGAGPDGRRALAILAFADPKKAEVGAMLRDSRLPGAPSRALGGGNYLVQARVERGGTLDQSASSALLEALLARSPGGRG